MNSDITLWLEIINQVKILIHTAKYEQCDKTDVNDVLDYLDKMEKMLDPNQHFSLAFSGMTNVGKSTLLNALLDEVVAPTKNCPWSSTSVEYVYSNGGYEIIVPVQGFRTLHYSCKSAQDLLNKLNDFAVEGGDYQTTKPLVVRIPNELLRGDITIVDTPGFGATDGCDNNALHDDILLSYLQKQSNSFRVFWIVKDNINQSALDFFKANLAGYCSDLIVNLTDDFNEDFKHSFESTYRPAVGQFVKFHYVNAKMALKARKKEDKLLLEFSGIEKLWQYLHQFSSPKQRIYLIADDLNNLFEGIRDYLYVNNHYKCLWIPTVWGTAKSLIVKTGNQKLYNTFLRMKE